MKKLLFIFLLLPLFTYSQDNPLSVFEPLIGKTWKADGKWGNNTKFKQEIIFQYALDSSIIIVNSKGFTNEAQTEFGNRNHGIRKYDVATERILFWEFDVFGNLTEGEVLREGRNIYYQYMYGESSLTDAWIYKNDSTYEFIVGFYNEGKWDKKFLETEFKKK